MAKTKKPINSLLLQFAIFSALGQILLICLVIARDSGGDILARRLLMLCLASAAYLICSDKLLMAQTGSFAYLLAVGSLSVPALLWLTTQTLFDDEFRLNKWQRLSIGLLLVIGYFNALSGAFFGTPQLQWSNQQLPNLTRIAQQLMNIGFMVSAIYCAYKGRGDDLVDARRRFRVYFVALTSATAISLALIELFLAPGQVMGFHHWVGPPIVLCAVTFFGYWLFSASGASVLKELAQQPASSHNSSKQPADQVTYTKLKHAFEERFIYREHGLTINSLASHLEVQEHHLRHLINQELGFKNFAAFLSRYRLKDVEQAFCDPKQAKTPILTIALTAGFQSITTFNRAFRHHYGTTPTAYRKNR